MIKYYNITNGDKNRVLLDPKALYQIYTNIAEGVRCYNRKGVWDAYRIKNRFIPKYIEVSPEFKITSKERVNTEFELAPGNKGF